MSADDEATGWFEPLYAAAARGETGVPWDRGGPSPQLVDWAAARSLEGTGRRALVVGAGLLLAAFVVLAIRFPRVSLLTLVALDVSNINGVIAEQVGISPYKPQ